MNEVRLSDEYAFTPHGELAGKVAFVTGGSTGVGYAICTRFLYEGAKVAAMALPDGNLEKARQELEAIAGAENFMIIPGDLTQEQQVVQAFDAVRQRFGRINVVVNNAGITRSAAIEDTTLEDFERILKVNTTAVFIVSRQAVRVFKQQGTGGNIINIASDDGLKPSRNFVAYNTSKAAVLHMARTIANECGPANIRVNSILPGAVFGRSQLWTSELRAARAKLHGFDPDQLEEEYKKHNPLHVIILPEEIADVASYLASDRTAKMTGNLITIDGGGLGGFPR